LLYAAAGAAALGFARIRAQNSELRTLTVLSYNIHHGEGTDGIIDLQRIANVIRPVDPDFVALQEVDRNTGRAGGVDQAQMLADLLDMPVVFGMALEFDGGQYGNALLTRHTIVSSVSHVVPHSEGREPRIVLDAEVEIGRGGNPVSHLWVLVTHLDHMAGDVDRLAAVDVIERVVESRGELPMILAGDLNATPDSEPLMRLRENWQIAGDEELLPTIPVGRPARQIDYVLCRPAVRWNEIETRVLEEAQASDHRPIAAVLELGGG
jgi:endonuclease/exonuclease/phosphatase family metal-dependent hydrolase